MSGLASVPLRILVVLFTFLLGPSFPAAAATPARVSEAYGKLPLHFEPNRGQAHDDVRFLSHGPGYSLYLTTGEAVLVLARAAPSMPVALRMSFTGAAREASVSGLEELPGKAHYFIGSDPAKWRSNVPIYGKVRYRELYRGVDLVYYGNQRQLEYDFVVAPGAEPQTIALDFKGTDRLEIDAQGDLVVHVAGATLRQHKPVIHQDIDGIRHEIAGGYVMKGAHEVGFQVAAYDRTRPLVIDPVLSYSTYLGGSADDQGWAIAVDTLGNAYVTGSTTSTNFPTAGALQSALGGNTDVFVTKLDATGSALVYSTYLGGSSFELALGIAVDNLGNAYVTGGTGSSNFPTTPGAFQSVLRGGGDAFVTKLNPTGSALLYSTYLGGSASEGGYTRIAVDSVGNAYVAGHTASTDFPTTAGAFQTSLIGVVAPFVTKLNAAGSALVYSTYLGGSSIQIGGSNFKEGIAIAVDSLGNAYVAGGTTSNSFPTTLGAFQPAFGGDTADAFVTKLDPTGSALLYSTYLGGSGYEQAFGIALDTSGNAYVTGESGSADFPTTTGALQSALVGGSDAFVTKLNATGSALAYSTYLGGNGFDSGSGIAVDSSGNAYVTGVTGSTDFPTTAGAFQNAFGGGLNDAWVSKFNAAGAALLYSTYLGGSDDDEGLGIALDSVGNAYVTGITSSTNFPTTTGTFQSAFAGVEDAFVAKFAEPTVTPPPSVGKVTGGGTIDLARGIGTFGFNVQRDAADAPIQGDLQYVNHASGAKVHSVMFTSFVINGDTASFGGSCTQNGAPCTFTVSVTDKGEPGTNDSFSITVDAGPTEGAAEKLRGGNIQIHR
jgi:beta-propeller repeat-containing protein